MDAPRRWKLSSKRVCGIVFGVGTQICFAITVYYLFFFLRDGSVSTDNDWLLIDCLLALQFAVVHSVLLLPSVRSSITRVLASQLYGSLFAAATCAGLWLMFRNWRQSPTTLWNADGWSRSLVVAGFYSLRVALVYSLRLGGLGYQTGWTQWRYWLRRQALPRRVFQERGAYRCLRHPVYLSFLGLIWFTPQMTADHAVLTGVWTTYIFVGSYLKDLRLTFYLGEVYRDYASRVAGYPGILFGPLGKWPQRQQSSQVNSRDANVSVQRAA